MVKNDAFLGGINRNFFIINIARYPLKSKYNSFVIHDLDLVGSELALKNGLQTSSTHAPVKLPHQHHHQHPQSIFPGIILRLRDDGQEMIFFQFQMQNWAFKI